MENNIIEVEVEEMEEMVSDVVGAACYICLE
ncbi:MAG: amino acid permease [bacterium]|nr:MAG: amino acid permease [bacterium]